VEVLTPTATCLLLCVAFCHFMFCGFHDGLGPFFSQIVLWIVSNKVFKTFLHSSACYLLLLSPEPIVALLLPVPSAGSSNSDYPNYATTRVKSHLSFFFFVNFLSLILVFLLCFFISSCHNFFSHFSVFLFLLPLLTIMVKDYCNNHLFVRLESNCECLWNLDITSV